MEEDFYLRMRYQGRTVKYKVVNPNATLHILMENLKHSKDKDGNFFFHLPNLDINGDPVEYFFGKKDEEDKPIILQPKLGKTECCLRDYNVKNGDTLEIVPDPIAG